MRVEVSLIPVNETMQLEFSPPREIKVIRGIGFMERHKKVGPDGLSPFFSKGGKEVFTPELTKLL